MSVIASGELSVSPADLLRRDDRQVHGEAAQALIRGRRVLVTGAGGSIGSEIVRQVSRLDPAALFLLDHDENALHSIQLELLGHGLLDTDLTILADIRDAAVLDRVTAAAHPGVVIHAAAHKHLPLLERFPTEGIRTNVLGTAHVVSAALAAGATTFVNISTDKAASPTSILGATKRLAEMVVTGHAGRGMRVCSVRFGNVLGSHGSFLRSLAFQVARQLPVTVTDPAVTRFFMTIPEAAGLVLEAATMARDGEIYVLDMGEPVRILDIVERYMRATGRPAASVVYTGLRPGEKLHEELYDATEDRQPTRHRRISCVLSTGMEDPGQAVKLAGIDPANPPALVREQVFALLAATRPRLMPAKPSAELVPA